MATATLTSKGQVTIPKEIRDRLGLEAGDELVFELREDGVVAVRPVAPPRVERLHGLLRRFAPATPVSIEAMHDAVRARAAHTLPAPRRRRRAGGR